MYNTILYYPPELVSEVGVDDGAVSEVGVGDRAVYKRVINYTFKNYNK